MARLAATIAVVALAACCLADAATGTPSDSPTRQRRANICNGQICIAGSGDGQFSPPQPSRRPPAGGQGYQPQGYQQQGGWQGQYPGQYPSGQGQYSGQYPSGQGQYSNGGQGQQFPDQNGNFAPGACQGGSICIPGTGHNNFGG